MTVPTFFGPETLVNVSTISNQDTADAAGLANGKYVIVWENSSSGNNNVVGRIYNADGSPATGEIDVNTTLSGEQENASVAALADGRFVIAWEDSSGGNNDVMARIFNVDGTPAGAEFIVNTTTIDDQENVHVAALTGGGFALAWEHNNGVEFDIFARVFDADGEALGLELVVDGENVNETQPAIAALSDGNFAVVWRDGGSPPAEDDGSGTHIRGQVFSGNGAEVSPEFIVNSTATNDQQQPAIAALPNGTFVVSWTHDFSPSNQDIRARVFSNGGAPLAADFVVDDETLDNELESTVTALPDGSYFIAWRDNLAGPDTDGSGSHVRGEIFSGVTGNGGSSVDEFIVNTITAESQERPSVATLADGRLIAVWDDDNSTTPPDSNGSNAVRAQLLDPRTVGVSLSGIGLPDDWIATAFTDVLAGYGGNDVLNGLAGNDRIDGGTGDDRLFGENGNDRLKGRPGNDWLDGGTGNDGLFGQNGNDRLDGRAGNDRLFGQNGNDRLDGGSGNDVLLGRNGNDHLDGGSGNDHLFGQNGTDRLDGGSGNDRLFGQNGDDVLLGGNGRDRLDGQVGEDVMFGGSGNDTLRGGNGNDRLFGGDGRDFLIGGTGNDRLDGGAGNDKLSGGLGLDCFLFTSAPSSRSNWDDIIDFSTSDDRIGLDNAVFTGLSAGRLPGSAFRVGDAALDANDRVIYNSATGALLFDKDGVGGAAAVKFAQVDAGLAMSNFHFFVL
jgi:Ca2+-binding RTX toxin-like protein